MDQSTQSYARSKPAKPEKPRPDFPLFAHNTGKWAKSIRGKTHYFGRWDDPNGAEEEYLAVAEDLHAGRVPESLRRGGATVRDMCNGFVKAKRIKLDAGNLSPRSFADVVASCKFLVDVFGSGRAVPDLTPADFEKLYTKLSERKSKKRQDPVSVATIKGEVGMIRSIFKYAYDADLIEKPVKFGPTFKAPSSTDLRKAKAKRKHLHGSKTFEAAEIKSMIGAASPQVTAMIYLGINAGFGNTDCATLPLSAIDLRNGWIDFPRPKTGADRRIPLWPETVAALKDVIAKRREPANPDDAQCVFLTRLGQRWVRFALEETKQYGKPVLVTKADDAVAKAIGKLLRELKIKRPGLSFYSLRHTFETISGGAKDQVATDAIMGHIDGTMAGNYRHGIEDARLRAVVDHVRAWLFEVSEV